MWLPASRKQTTWLVLLRVRGFLLVAIAFASSSGAGFARAATHLPPSLSWGHFFALESTLFSTWSTDSALPPDLVLFTVSLVAPPLVLH